MTKLEHLFKSNYKALCLYATHIVGDIDTAEDIVMDYFLMLAEQPERDERILSMKNYIYRMVRNACTNHLGTKVSITDPQHIPDVPDDEDDFRERCEREARLWKEIDRLPRACRDVFLMHKRDGLCHRDIADRLDISIKTVEAHIGHAYAVLRGKAGIIYAFIFL